MVLSPKESHKETGSDELQVSFQPNYFVFLFPKAMTMLSFSNVSGVKKIMNVNGCYEDVQTYELLTQCPQVEMLKEAAMFLDHSLHRGVQGLGFDLSFLFTSIFYCRTCHRERHQQWDLACVYQLLETHSGLQAVTPQSVLCNRTLCSGGMLRVSSLQYGGHQPQVATEHTKLPRAIEMLNFTFYLALINLNLSCARGYW